MTTIILNLMPLTYILPMYIQTTLTGGIVDGTSHLVLEWGLALVTVMVTATHIMVIATLIMDMATHITEEVTGLVIIMDTITDITTGITMDPIMVLVDIILIMAMDTKATRDTITGTAAQIVVVEIMVEEHLGVAKALKAQQEQTLAPQTHRVVYQVHHEALHVQLP